MSRQSSYVSFTLSHYVPTLFYFELIKNHSVLFLRRLMILVPNKKLFNFLTSSPSSADGLAILHLEPHRETIQRESNLCSSPSRVPCNRHKKKMMTVEVIAAVLAVSSWPNRGLPFDPMVLVGKLRSQATF